MKKAFLSVLMMILIVSAVCQPLVETAFASMEPPSETKLLDTTMQKKNVEQSIAEQPVKQENTAANIRTREVPEHESVQEEKVTTVPEQESVQAEKVATVPEKESVQAEKVTTAPEQQSASEEAAEVMAEGIPLSEELVQTALTACEQYEVPPQLLFAVMEVESGFQTDAQNGACTGLMQIHSINLPYLQEQIGISDLSDPEQNIQAGAFILGGYLSRYNTEDSLMAYNLGEGGAKKQWEQGIHGTAYTEKVLNEME